MMNLIKLALEQYANSNTSEHLKHEFLKKFNCNDNFNTNASFVRTCVLTNMNRTLDFEVHPGTRCLLTATNYELNYDHGIVTEKNNTFAYPKFVDVEIPDKGIFTVLYNNGTNQDPDFNLELDLKTSSLCRGLYAFKRTMSDIKWSGGLGMDLILNHNKRLFTKI